MIKLNNKGFAISTLLYSMIILVMMIVMIMLSIMATTRKTTKELSETIEQELTGHAKKEAEFNGSGTFTYEIPKVGWYKIEIWDAGTREYGSLVKQYTTVGAAVQFDISSTEVKVTGVTSLDRTVSYPGLSYSKAKIKLVSEAAAATPPSKETTSSPLNNGKYYISNSYSGQQVLTADIDNNSVSFKPLNGGKNQEWVVEAVKDAHGIIEYYKIINSATGLILGPEEEAGAANTNLVVDNLVSNSDQEWIKWKIDHKGLGKYEIITPLSNNALTFDETEDETVLGLAGSSNSQFYFLYSQY